MMKPAGWIIVCLVLMMLELPLNVSTKDLYIDKRSNRVARDDDWVDCGSDFRCADMETCVDKGTVCDGNNDCWDGSDENDNYCNPATVGRKRRAIFGENGTAEGRRRRDIDSIVFNLTKRSTADLCPGCSDLMRLILEKQNQYRAESGAANMNEMHWDNDAEAKAKDWAEVCSLSKWSENPHGMMEGEPGQPDYSQNVGRVYIDNRPADEYFLMLVDMWFDEVQWYTFDSNSCEDGQQCGHYTTMMGAYQTQMGCHIHKCTRTKGDGLGGPLLSDSEGHDGEDDDYYGYYYYDRRRKRSDDDTEKFWILVCDYQPGFPWEVYPGHPNQPFIKGEECSFCQGPDGSMTCENHLCV